MGHDRSNTALEIAEAAARLEAAERPAFIEGRCGTDADLRVRVDRLLDLRFARTGAIRPGAPDAGPGGTALEPETAAGRRPAGAEPTPALRLPGPPPTVRGGSAAPRVPSSSAAPTSDSGTVPAGGTPAIEEAPTLDPGAVPADAIASRLAGGSRIGPYRVVEQLGAGGMGAVYLAEQEVPVRRTVAIKVIKLGMDTQEVVTRFEAERQALAMMDHESIARVFDAGTTSDGRPYFVMEHVRGVPLQEYCDRSCLGVTDRLKLFLDVCDAVQHAHHKGIIHRDLKPSNVLVTEQGRKRVPKIIDFGIAKAINQRLVEKTLLTEMGVMIGTPEYMSPEQAEIGVDDIDTRSDVYSLGVMLYELLVGALPFPSSKLRAAGFVGMQRIIREEEAPAPSSRIARGSAESSAVAGRRGTAIDALSRQVRGDLDWIVLKALEKDRSRRYGSAAELAADVGRHLADEPVLARAPTLRYRLRKFAIRRRKALTVAAAFAAVVVAIVWGTLHATAERALAERTRRTEDLRSEGLRLLGEYRQSKRRLEELEEAWRRTVDRQPGWAPVWERGEELAAWDAVVSLRNQPDARYLECVQLLTQASDIAPSRGLRDAASRALETAYWERYREAYREGGVRLSGDYFAGLVRSLALGTHDAELEGREAIEIESDPEDVEVLCFRYEEHERRLIPLPFDPRAGRDYARLGLLAAPFLEVERVEDAAAHAFRPGDRILRVAGREVRLGGDLAGALSGVKAGESVEVTVSRGDASARIAWVPFPPASRPDADPDPESPFRPGRTIDFRHQLGLTLSGYPLDRSPGSLLGTTAAGRPLRVELPRGSYLLLFRKAGFAESRFPLSVPRERAADDDESGDHRAVRVRMVRADDVPPGFVHVPAGPVGHGNPREPFREELFQSLELGTTFVEDFLIGRCEVTFAEYLEFLDDPEVLARTDGQGIAEPWTEEVRAVLQTVGGKLRLVPVKSSGDPFLDRTSEGWRIPEKLDPSWPAFSIQQVAAKEYAAWRTRRSDRWTFRLPTDLEWEKAARGADRRRYPWGDYLVWSFCASAPGSYYRSPVPAGCTPLDESVYGLRDVAGSVSEHTSGAPAPGFAYTSLRGGSWVTTDAYRFRIVTRFGRNPAGMPATDAGFRLVAVPR